MLFCAQIRKYDTLLGTFSPFQNAYFRVSKKDKLTDTQIIALGMTKHGLSINDYQKPMEGTGPDGSTYYYVLLHREGNTLTHFYLFIEEY